jgi:hypothetical protein
MKTYSWLKQNCLLLHLRTTFCALTIVGASLTLPGAEGGPPIQAAGTFAPCFNYLSVEFLPPGSDPSNFITALTTFNITGTGAGTLTGTFIGTEMDVVHHSDGSINLHGTLVFTGSVNGGPEGTLVFTYEGIGNAVTGQETLRAVGTQGTGGLAGVYANITLEGQVLPPAPGCALSGSGTYTGQVIFAP